MIKNSSIEALKNIIDIIDIISNYIEIKKMGVNFQGLCPFHSEKTASFVVSPSKQIYHCFGCGVGGDAIKFVMEKEKFTYPEALEKIATILNFSLEYSKNNFSSGISDFLNKIGVWYIENLKLNKFAMKYLLSRGVTEESIKIFNLGYTESSFAVLNFLKKNFLAMDKAVNSGILTQDDRGNYYARLIDRIIFPIYNSSNLLIGFGGRTIKNHPAKYINSPQTKLFNKSQVLYGYSIAKEHIIKNRIIIICEGYLDVIMFHQAGFKEAVASLGTALTEQHLPLLRRGEPKIILAYDGDKAGVNAALKVSTLLSKNNFDGYVILFPKNKDPADMILNNEIKYLKKIIKSGYSFINFTIKKIFEKYDINNNFEKESAFNEIKIFIYSLTPISQNSSINFASSILNIPQIYFKQKNINNSNINKNLFDNKEDIIELSIIKTILENRENIDINLVKKIKYKIFNFSLMKIADIAISNDINDDNYILINPILINPNIFILNQENFNSAIIKLLIKFYLRELNSIKISNNLSYREKSLKIKKYKT